jgi:RNA polymerase sigma-70 factor (ECF subfamily)
VSIINLFRNRTKPADRFEHLLRPHIDTMYRFAFRLCGSRDDAEELVQSFLTRLYPKFEKIEKIEKLSPWLCRGLYNLYVDGYRRQQRENKIFDVDEMIDEASDDTDTTLIRASNIELSSRIESALENLNPDQRMVVMLHDSEGYTLEELSEILADGGDAARFRGLYAGGIVRDPAGAAGHAQVTPEPRPCSAEKNTVDGTF